MGGLPFGKTPCRRDRQWEENAKRHPADMGEADVTRFLSSLAVEAKVSVSTQHQALSALLFLDKEGREQPPRGWLQEALAR